MANNNEYLPFATTTGALTLAPSAYAALATRLSGFGNGIADPAEANTAWRQASVIAAMIAQFTADYGPSDVLDNGNVTQLENQYLAALQTALTQTPAPGTPYEGVDTGSANAMFVSTTTPASGTLTSGQIYVIQKGTSANTSAVTLKIGSNSPVNVFYPNGDNLGNGDWPANAIGIVYYDGSRFQYLAARHAVAALTLGGLVKDANSNFALNYDNLPINSSIAGTDKVALFSEVSEGGLTPGTPYAASLSTFAAAILAYATGSVSAAQYTRYQVFFSSGTFTPDPGCTAAEVIGCWGAGGGGGNAYGYVGAGGGGGGFCAGTFACTPGQPVAVVVGAGGAAQQAGGNSSVGSFCTAFGGSGAGGNTPGAGGVTSGGQLTFSGTSGATGSQPGGGNVFVGAGGSAFNGRGGGGSGATAPYPGGGGAGSGDYNGQTGYTGGAGLVIIKQLIGG